MSPLVFVKLFAIFAVVAIGWAVARSGRLGGGDPSRVIAGAAVSHQCPDRLRAPRCSRRRRLLPADDRRPPGRLRDLALRTCRR
jgi:hypothetical protein